MSAYFVDWSDESLLKVVMQFFLKTGCKEPLAMVGSSKEFVRIGYFTETKNGLDGI